MTDWLSDEFELVEISDASGRKVEMCYLATVEYSGKLYHILGTVHEDEADEQIGNDCLLLVRQDCTPDGAQEYVVTEDENEIEQVFGPVSDEVFENSIYQDIRTAQEDILKAPVYVILNLCRAVAYLEEGLLLSKREGGEWALNDWQLAPYQGMIRAALKAYQDGENISVEKDEARGFASIVLKKWKTIKFALAID